MTGVDFHQHVWPDEFRRALERRSSPPYLRGNVLVLPHAGSFEVDVASYTPEARLDELDRNGLGRAVVSLAPTTEPTPELAAIWNEAAPKFPDRLVPLAYGESLPRFAGAIVSAPALGFLDELAPMLTRLELADQLLFVHPGPADPGGPAWRTDGVSYTAQLVAAFASWISGGAARWPRLKIVFALLGGGAPFHVERLIRRGLEPRAPFAGNVWFDTSSYGERAVELSLQTYGAGRFVFGSDAPIDRVRDALHVVERFGSALELDLLVSNPLDLLGPERRRWAA